MKKKFENPGEIMSDCNCLNCRIGRIEEQINQIQNMLESSHNPGNNPGNNPGKSSKKKKKK